MPQRRVLPIFVLEQSIHTNNGIIPSSVTRNYATPGFWDFLASH
ncbi:MAG: hypothetical protein ACJ746_01300 [Bryobacteraceae bacterium]